jgi:hypothetical protein
MRPLQTLSGSNFTIGEAKYWCYHKVMPEDKPRVEQEKSLLIWKAPSRPYKAPGRQFLTVPMVIGILVGIIFLLAGEWMAIAVIAAIIFAYYMWSTVPPQEAEFAITNRGIRVGGQLFVWDALSRWWMGEKWGQKMLMVETPVSMVGRLIMPLGETPEVKVTEIMNKYLLRERPNETWMDKTGRWMTDKFPLEQKA